jgi:hypothetical protein
MNCRPFAVVTLATVSLVPAGYAAGKGSTSHPATATATILPSVTNHVQQPSKNLSLVTKYITPDGHLTLVNETDAQKIVIVDLP